MVKILLTGISVTLLMLINVSSVTAEENWVFGNTQNQIKYNYNSASNYTVPRNMNYVQPQVRINNTQIPDIIRQRIKFEESRNSEDRMLPVKRGSKKPMC
jgi:hypothetical protein